MKKRFADEQIAFVLRQAGLMYFEADVLPLEEEGARCLDASLLKCCYIVKRRAFNTII